MDPTATDNTLAKRKRGDQKSLNSKKTSKKSLRITLNIIIFGIEAKSKVTLVIAPS
jgi:hypothetical protein